MFGKMNVIPIVDLRDAPEDVGASLEAEVGELWGLLEEFKAMKRDLRFEAFYDIAPEEVWRALTDSEALAQWFRRNDSVPEKGHKCHFYDTLVANWNGIVCCQVQSVGHQTLDLSILVRVHASQPIFIPSLVLRLLDFLRSSFHTSGIVRSPKTPLGSVSCGFLRSADSLLRSG